MASSLNPKERALYSAVDEVLHYVWDPIGVAGNPHARDEYYSYIPRLVSMLTCGASEAELLAYLDDAAAHMGLLPNPGRDREVVNVLFDWREALNEKFA